MSSEGSHRPDSIGAQRVRTAVIPAAGHGTRMLPATKSVPKELLPLGERPALQYIVEEAVGAGVDHLIVVSSPTKPAIAEYLSPSPEVEDVLIRLGRGDLAREQHRYRGEVTVTIVIQDEARGLGHAVACAREAVGDEPFFVLLPDELMAGSDLLLEMADVHASARTSVIAVKSMPADEISRYGVVAPVDVQRPQQLDRSMRSESRIVLFDDVVEKPQPDHAPSDLAIIGRYLLTPDIFEDLDAIRPGANGELQLTDALALQAGRRPSSALISPIGRRDIGHPLGWIQAVIDEALHHPQLGPSIRSWLVEQLGDDSTSA